MVAVLFIVTPPLAGVACLVGILESLEKQGRDLAAFDSSEARCRELFTQLRQEVDKLAMALDPERLTKKLSVLMATESLAGFDVRFATATGDKETKAKA